jgi:ankyrin repeat protein
VAAFTARAAAARALVAGGAQANALDGQRYDIVTIAAVRNDVATLRLALTLGASPRNVTSPYDGTALIAAAHLGHDEVVRELIRAGAPLDHINNLGWTALLEAVILGDGGPRHVAVLRDLVRAGANPALADRQGVSALEHARKRGYIEMVAILDSAGRR